MPPQTYKQHWCLVTAYNFSQLLINNLVKDKFDDLSKAKFKHIIDSPEQYDHKYIVKIVLPFLFVTDQIAICIIELNLYMLLLFLWGTCLKISQELYLIPRMSININRKAKVQGKRKTCGNSHVSSFSGYHTKFGPI